MSSTELKRGAFIELANNHRKKNPKDWVMLVELVEGKMVRYKAFGTWVQKLTIDGVPYSFSNTMNGKVKDFRSFLDQTLTRYL